MNHRARMATYLGVALGLGVIGCDEPKHDVADDLPEVPHKQEPVATRPTTQSLLEGPKQNVSLGLIPFSVEAPEGWKVVIHESREGPGVSMLEGPLITPRPDDQAQIIIGLRDPLTGGMRKVWLDRAAKEDAEFRPLGGLVEVRETGDVLIIDRRRPPSTGTTQPSEVPMDWRITLLVPEGVRYEQYELKFLALSVDAYKQNKELLEALARSIKFNRDLAPPLPR